MVSQKSFEIFRMRAFFVHCYKFMSDKKFSSYNLIYIVKSLQVAICLKKIYIDKS